MSPEDAQYGERKGLPRGARIALTAGAILLAGIVAVVAGFSVAFHRSPLSVVMRSAHALAARGLP